MVVTYPQSQSIRNILSSHAGMGFGVWNAGTWVGRLEAFLHDIERVRAESTTPTLAMIWLNELQISVRQEIVQARLSGSDDEDF